MKILIGCEESGVVREAFRKRGHDAWSCDLLPARDGSKFHFQKDVLELLCIDWDMAIFFPPCDYVCGSGMHWTTRGLRDPKLTEDALIFFKQLLDAPIPKKCLENPIGIISTRIKKPSQVIQPYNFGNDASKGTCLWLDGLPLLKPTKYVEPRIVNGRKRWANQTDSGQNKLAPGKNRKRDRATTYPGIAEAMAEQWG